jgi:Zn-dependent peptidase ImmA (M78 family)/DNA-binding XRE family transcriptional regulator
MPANFKMIELARSMRGITQKELASDLNITQATFSKIERGELGMTESTVSQIATILKFPIAFFHQEELKTPISNIYFRKRASIPTKVLDKIIADVKVILRSIDYLLEEVEIAEYPKYKFDLSDGWTAKSIATRFRELLKIPNGPIHTPVKYLEQLGIIVFFYDCKDLHFDGLTAYTDNGVPVIFVNKNMPNDRIKFTLGHELLHLFSHIPCDIEPWRDFESEANELPGELFMPTRECSADLAKLGYNQLTGLKAYWGMSKASIIYKAKSLGLISESTYKYLMIELSRRGERKSEQGFVEIDKPTILQMVIDLLHNELDYSEQDIADKLCMPIEDYKRLFTEDKGIEPLVKVRRLRPAI